MQNLVKIIHTGFTEGRLSGFVIEDFTFLEYLRMANGYRYICDNNTGMVLRGILYINVNWHHCYTRWWCNQNRMYVLKPLTHYEIQNYTRRVNFGEDPIGGLRKILGELKNEAFSK